MEKARERNFTGPGPSVGSVSRGVQLQWACATGALVCSFYHPCPSFGRAPELDGLMSSL